MYSIFYSIKLFFHHAFHHAVTLPPYYNIIQKVIFHLILFYLILSHLISYYHSLLISLPYRCLLTLNIK